MLRRLTVLSLMAALLSGAAAAEEDSCVACHRDEVEDEIVPMVRGDAHHRRGLSCADCHGGDPAAADMEEAMDPARGYVGVPERTEIPAFCGRCHHDAAYMRQDNPGLRVDQLELYWTSNHGQRLQGGDEKVATCIDCHGSHGALPASDPRSSVYPTNVPGTCSGCHSDSEYMAAYGIPTNQYEAYRTSVHGALLLERGGRGAPACNDCHGNHGAAPPGVSSVTNVCGQCHPVNADLVAKSPHAEPFEEMGVPACESCHGHHDIGHPTDGMLGSGEGSVCITCHEEDSKGYLSAVAMKGAIDDLQRRTDEAGSLLHRAERAGMEVRDARFQLNEVENSLTKARATMHAFSLKLLEDVLAEGRTLADSTGVQGRNALAELDYRRKGLGVSLVVIVIVGIALLMKIREVDRKRGLKP